MPPEITIGSSHLLYVATSILLQSSAENTGGLATFKVGYTKEPNVRMEGMRGKKFARVPLFGMDDWIIYPVLWGTDKVISIEEKIHTELNDYKEFFVPNDKIGNPIGSGYSEVYCIDYDKRSGFFRKYRKSKNSEFKKVVDVMREVCGLIGPPRLETKNVVGFKEDSKRR